MVNSSVRLSREEEEKEEEMINAKRLYTISIVLNVVLSIVLILTVAALVEARSGDVVRLTVTSDNLLPTVRGIQGSTGLVLNAYPLGIDEDTAKYWRIEYKEQD
jgi:hypothetical protein